MIGGVLVEDIRDHFAAERYISFRDFTVDVGYDVVKIVHLHGASIVFESISGNGVELVSQTLDVVYFSVWILSFCRA